MSDFKLPDLPSDEELGLTKEEIEALEKELGEDSGPEMSAAEMAALFGEPAPAPKAPPAAGAGTQKSGAAPGGAPKSPKANTAFASPSPILTTTKSKLV